MGGSRTSSLPPVQGGTEGGKELDAKLFFYKPLVEICQQNRRKAEVKKVL
jgi:hypothetical protein